MKLLTLTSVVLMGLVINNAIRRSNARSKKIHDEFWEKEKASYRAPERSTENLDYVRFPDNLPLHLSTDDLQIKEYQETLENLTKQKVLNLSGISNTDIRMSYGRGNMEELSRADERYTVVCRTLNNLASAYMDRGFTLEACTLSEFAVSIGSDIRESWLLLGRIYMENDDITKLNSLIKKAEELDGTSISKEEILKSLKETRDIMELVS